MREHVQRLGRVLRRKGDKQAILYELVSAGTGEGVGYHLLGGNIYDKNKAGEIRVGPGHPAIRQLQDRWPSEGSGGINLPVKTTTSDPADPVDGLLYLNTADDKLRVYADGAWRSLQSTTGTSW